MDKSCGKRLAVMLTSLRALKLKTLSVSPALGLRADVRMWFPFPQKKVPSTEHRVKGVPRLFWRAIRGPKHFKHLSNSWKILGPPRLYRGALARAQIKHDTWYHFTSPHTDPSGNGMHFVYTRSFVLSLIGLIYRVTLDKLVKGFLDLFRVDQAFSKHSVKWANFLTISHSRPLTGRRASLQPTNDLISVSLVSNHDKSRCRLFHMIHLHTRVPMFDIPLVRDHLEMQKAFFFLSITPANMPEVIILHLQ